MNKKIIIVLTIILIIVLTLGILFLFKDSIFNSKEKIAINYLNNKYGDGDWNIISSEDYIYEYTNGFNREIIKDGVKLKITSSYINNNHFYLHINKHNMVTNDYFIPTYYSYKYDITYNDLVKGMVYISTYHYPYEDYNKSDNWHTSKPYCRINAFLMRSFYEPISVQTSPKKEKVLDIIYDEKCIPEIKEIIERVEEYYSSGRMKNQDTNEDELYKLLFEEKVEDDEIISFISNHIIEVKGLKIQKIKKSYID